MGVKNDGRIVAVQVRSVADGGAYGMSTEGVMRKHAILVAGPYDIPNVKIDAYGIYTNNTPSGAFRSFGGLQGQFATESHLDIIAGKLDLDPIELRRINVMRDGAITHTQQQLRSVSIGRVLDACAEAAGWEPGTSDMRGSKRGDLGRFGTRKAATVGARVNPPVAERMKEAS
jgi:CO/xanthine dehydrogenase Mo-binding subunit